MSDIKIKTIRVEVSLKFQKYVIEAEIQEGQDVQQVSKTLRAIASVEVKNILKDLGIKE